MFKADLVNSTPLSTKMKSRKQGLVVCGTGTDIGKTIISALLVQGLKAIYWKPIQSGLIEGSDRRRICKMLNLKEDRWIKEAYNFKAPVSPHWAAEKENKLIDPSQLKLPTVEQPLIIETAGGLMVPLTREWLQIDQIKCWDLPVLLVTRTELGTLNHTLLSIEALRARSISMLGLFLNGPEHPDNPKTLEKFGEIPILGHLPPLQELTSQALNEQWQNQQLDITFKRLLFEQN